MREFIAFDLPPLLGAMAAAISCAVLGNFLLLRRMALMGDAIAHSVLPGIVVAFLVSGSRSALPVSVGAIVSGLSAALLIEATKRLGRVEPGAAMGVVFSIFFALGVLLMERASAANVDLDADCLLHGQLETLFWTPPSSLTVSAFLHLPSEVFLSLGVLGMTTVFVVALWKELMLASFDPELATALGFRAKLLHELLMVFVALAVVASFKVVGSILVIAMIIVPGATARLLTDRLRTQVWLSIAVAVSSTIAGYILAGFVPIWLGFEHSLGAAGMMTVVLGFSLTLAVIFAPKYGVLSGRRRNFELAARVYGEDLLAELFRSDELRAEEPSRGPVTRASFLPSGEMHRAAEHGVAKLISAGMVVEENGTFTLTEAGRCAARDVVRAHRLWESFLVRQAGLQRDHVHERASALEHFTSKEVLSQLAAGQPGLDPHGRPIPEGGTSQEQLCDDNRGGTKE